MHFNKASSTFMTLLAPWDALSHWLNDDEREESRLLDLRV